MNNYGLRCNKCNKMMGVILSDYTVNIGDKCKVLCPQCFIQHEDEPKILKCPGCGSFPALYSNFGGYKCHCTHYPCNFIFSIKTYNRTDAIEAWNEAVIRYKEGKDG